MNRITFITLLFLHVVALDSMAQNIGTHTTNPQAPFHVYNSGQVNTPGGWMVLGNTSEAHMEFDFDRLQSKFNNSLLPMFIQPEGGNLNLSNGRVFIDHNNGEIGLHTISPNAPIHMYTVGEVNTPGGFVVLGNTNQAHLELDFDRLQSKYNNSLLPMFIQPEGGNLDLSSGKIFIDYNNGEIGVHTSSPNAPVHMYTPGEINTPGGFLVLGNTNQAHLELDFDRIQSEYSTTSHLTLNVQPDGGDLNLGSGALFVDNANNRVGIGTTGTSARLHVRGAGFNSSTVGLHVTNILGNSMLYVNDGGFVGINGVTSPSAALEVNGAIEIASDLKSRINLNSKLSFLNNGNDLALQSNNVEMLRLNGTTNILKLAANSNTKISVGTDNANEAKMVIYTGDGTTDLLTVHGLSSGHYFKANGRVGLGITEPESNVHIYCSGTESFGGLKLENFNQQGSDWRLYVNEESQEENGNLVLFYKDNEVGYFSTGGSYFPTSDARDKTDIMPMENVLDKVLELKTKTYFFNHDQEREKREIGFLAQELNEHFPELVGYSKKRDQFSVNYMGMSVVAIKAIQELASENQELKDQVESLEARISKLEQLVASR